jgi:glycerol-3-phosphate O-acyltransferase / dihydroxyacetone phosphate acyltransferase
MALQAESEAEFRLNLKIMPIGLNFLARKSFRRGVMINFGSPLEVSSYKTSYKSDEKGAVLALTQELQGALEDQILHYQNTELQPLIQDIEKIYKDYLTAKLLEEGHPERAEDFVLSRRIIEAAHFYQRYFPEKFEKLRDAILHYKRQRDYTDIKEKAFKRELREGFSTGFFLPVLIEGIIGAPIFLYGASQNLLPYIIPRLLGHASARKETDYATIRFLASIIAFPLIYGVQTALCVYFFGPIVGLLYLISLPLSAVYALLYLHGIAYFRHKVYLFYLFMNNRNIIYKLSIERQSIIDQLNEARALFLQAIEKSEV